MKTVKKKSSAALVDIILLQGQTLGMYLWRQNNLAVKGRKFVGKKGVGDVIGLTRNGTHVEIEIKIGDDHQSDAQFLHMNNIRAKGGHYYVVKTVDDVIEVMKKISNE